MLMISIIPHESWHLLMNHNDSHCEFRHDHSVEAKHQHCEMLAFEISNFETIFHKFNIQLFPIKNLQILYSDCKNPRIYQAHFLSRGPPIVIA